MACGINSFEASHPGVKIEYVSGQGSEIVAKAEASKDNPAIDLMLIQDADLYHANQLGLIGTVDTKLVPNIKSVNKAYGTTTPRYSGAVAMGTLIQELEYNTAVFKKNGWAAPSSWKDLWDPRYKGHVGILNITVAGTQLQLQLYSQINGGSPTNVQPGFKVLEQLKPSFYSIMTTSAELNDALQQQHVWITATSGNQIKASIAQGSPVDAVQPKEGVELSTVWMTLVKGAKYPQLAESFMNWMLDAKQQNCIGPTVGMGPVRTGVTIAPDVKKYVLPLPGEKVIPTNVAAIQKDLPDWVTEWNSEIAK